MDISMFLGRVVGLYLIITSLCLMLNAKTLRAVVNDSMKNTSISFLMTDIALIIGLLMINAHNLWVPNWRLIITIVGWIAFLKGLIGFLFPKIFWKLAKNFINNNLIYYISYFVSLVAGISLVYFTFVP